MSSQLPRKSNGLVKQTARTDLRLIAPTTVITGRPRPGQLLCVDKRTHNHRSSLSPHTISPVPSVSIDPPPTPPTPVTPVTPSHMSRCGTPQYLLGRRRLTLLKNHSISSRIGSSSSSIASYDSGLGLSRGSSKSSILGRTEARILDCHVNDSGSDSPHILEDKDRYPATSDEEEEEEPDQCIVKVEQLRKLFQVTLELGKSIKQRSNSYDSSSSEELQHNDDDDESNSCLSQWHECQEPTTDNDSIGTDSPFRLSPRRQPSNGDNRRRSSQVEQSSNHFTRRNKSASTIPRTSVCFQARPVPRRTNSLCVHLSRRRANTCPAKLPQPSVVIKRAIPKRLRKQCTEVLKVCAHGESHYEELVVNLKHTNRIDDEPLLHHLRETRLARLVKENLPLFIESTDWTYLLSHVIAKDLADPNTQQKLMGICTSIDKSNYFYILVLPSKGRDAYSRFYKCLCEEQHHSGHQDLASLLRQGLKSDTTSYVPL